MSEIKKGTTSRTEYLRLVTTSGTPLLGAVIASMYASYTRDRSLPVSSLMSALSSEGAAHAGFKGFEIYSGFSVGSNWAPGLYRADFPDSAFVSGVDKVILAITHPLADPAMKEYALVDNIESDTFTVVSSNATAVGSVQIGVNSLYARIGAPTGASMATDVGSVQIGVNSIYGRIGAAGAGLTALASSGDLATANINVTSLHTRVGSVATQVGSVWFRTDPLPTDPADESLVIAATDAIMTRLGAPVGVNLSADVSSIQTMATSIYARIGASAGASASVDIASVQAGVTANANAISSLHTRIGSADTRVSSAATQVDSAYARMGAPIGASLAVDIGSVQTMTTSLYARIGAPTGASASVDIGSVQAGVAANATALASLHTRVGSSATQVGSTYTGVGSLSIGVNVDRVSSDANAATNLYRGALGTAIFTVADGSTTGILSLSALSPAAATADQFKGRILTFDRDTGTAALRGQATDILSSAATGVLGVTSLTNAPATGDKGVIT